MLMKPGFSKYICDSRHDQSRANDDEDFIMTDIHHGSALRPTLCVKLASLEQYAIDQQIG